jgi:hypothetical protein
MLNRVIDFLRPKQAVDLVIARVRKRIQVLRDTRIDGYSRTGGSAGLAGSRQRVDHDPRVDTNGALI